MSTTPPPRPQTQSEAPRRCAPLILGNARSHPRPQCSRSLRLADPRQSSRLSPLHRACFASRHPPAAPPRSGRPDVRPTTPPKRGFASGPSGAPFAFRPSRHPPEERGRAPHPAHAQDSPDSRATPPPRRRGPTRRPALCRASTDPRRVNLDGSPLQSTRTLRGASKSAASSLTERVSPEPPPDPRKSPFRNTNHPWGLFRGKLSPATNGSTRAIALRRERETLCFLAGAGRCPSGQSMTPPLCPLR